MRLHVGLLHHMRSTTRPAASAVYGVPIAVDVSLRVGVVISSARISASWRVVGVG